MKRKRSYKEYRKKRRRVEKDEPPIPITGKVPDKIDSIEDLIQFTYSYNGTNIDITKLKRIVPALLELNSMIGLKNTKTSILDMIMHFVQGRHRKNQDYLHMVVCGPPGTGKTTFCRILGKILAGVGVLSKGTFTVLKRTDFVAKYLGQTAHKTEKILKEVKGGVAFIDEAYSLAPRDSDRDSFAKEAIDFLNQFLSEHKDDFCCIIAGYEEQLENTIFSMNNGLKRRFPWKFVIDPYTEHELYQICCKMVKESGYTLAEGAIDPKFFLENKDHFKFAGGDIETFITKCKFIHTRNTFGKSADSVLTKKDITDAITEHKKHKGGKDNQPPIMMYM